MSYKDRIRKSIEQFSKKHDGLPKKRKKKNSNVEGPVVLEIKNYFNDLGWSLQVIESKAVYSEAAGRYIGGQTKAGTSDLVGNTVDGVACFIEVKAKGKRSTLRPDQRQFLIEKISTNCFAVCADSAEYVLRVYQEWRKSETKKAFLLKELPELSPRYADQDLNLE